MAHKRTRNNHKSKRRRPRDSHLAALIAAVAKINNNKDMNSKHKFLASGTTLRGLPVFVHWSSQQPHYESTIISPIVQMRKVIILYLNDFPEVNIANKGWRQYLNPVNMAPTSIQSQTLHSTTLSHIDSLEYKKVQVLTL